MTQAIATPTRTKEILQKYDLRLNKRMGQNFLIDKNIIDNIVSAADLKPDDRVIEIGPGIGALTEAILDRISNGFLVTIEKDNRFINILKDIFSNSTNLEIINNDVLNLDWQEFLDKRNWSGSEVKIIANLPYYITTPIIMHILESDIIFSELVFMVQKEVAERMVASPGGKDYGALSVGVQFYARVEITHDVPPSVFIPRPRVSSSIIRLTPYKQPPVAVINKEFFFKVVRAIFQQRRKNIKNSLTIAPHLSISRELIKEGLKEAGIDFRLRGEKLSLKELASLSNILWKKSGDNIEIC